MGELLEQAVDTSDRQMLLDEFTGDIGMSTTDATAVLGALDKLAVRVAAVVASVTSEIRIDSAARCITRFMRFVILKKKGGNSTVNRLFGLNDAANQVRAKLHMHCCGACVIRP